jgi:hypothetical protein
MNLLGGTNGYVTDTLYSEVSKNVQLKEQSQQTAFLACDEHNQWNTVVVSKEYKLQHWGRNSPFIDFSPTQLVMILWISDNSMNFLTEEFTVHYQNISPLAGGEHTKQAQMALCHMLLFLICDFC